MQPYCTKAPLLALLFAQIVLADQATQPTQHAPDLMVAANTSLDRILPNATWQKIDLSTVINSLAKAGNVAIDVNWDQLQSVGIKPTSLIEGRYKNCRIRGLLRGVLAQEVSVDTLVATVLPSGHVLVTTRTDAYGRLATLERYPVGELIADADPSKRPLVRKEIGDYIREAIAPNSWSNSADQPGGTLVFEGDIMVVRQTPDIQQQVKGWLEQTRAESKKP